MPTDQDPVEVVRAALAELDRAHATAVAAVEDAPDLDSALAAVNLLHTRLQELINAVTVLRTRIVGRVWDAQRLSLSDLADRVGISKSRAEQLIKKVKKAKEEPL